MEKFNFDVENLDLEVVKTNVRPSSDDKPYLRLSETPGRFSLNSLATEALKLQAGDYVSLIRNKKATSLNGQYFLTKGSGSDVAKLYSPTGVKDKVGVALSFTQATTYSRMIQNKVDAFDLSAEKLEELGLFVSRPSKKNPENRNYSSLITITLELVEGPVLEDGTQLYGLVNPVFNTRTATEVVEIEDSNDE